MNLQMAKTWAVIVAAGKGKRMGAGLNKQFINVKGKPLLFYTLKAFSDCEEIDKIVVVCAPKEIDYCNEEIIKKYNFQKVHSIVSGGEERHQSVLSGLKALDDCEVVLIHDGARPFVSDTIIRDGIKYARIYDACACGVIPKDTIKIMDEFGFSVSTPKREQLFCVQTPQSFKFDLILSCYNKLKNQERVFTDDTSLVEYFGHKVFLYQGSYSNIKVTTPEDLFLAESIIK